MLWLRVSSHMRSFWSDEALPRGRPRLAAQFFMLRSQCGSIIRGRRRRFTIPGRYKTLDRGLIRNHSA
jgi:hypothetical protein